MGLYGLGRLYMRVQGGIWVIQGILGIGVIPGGGGALWDFGPCSVRFHPPSSPAEGHLKAFQSFLKDMSVFFLGVVF